jgi:flavin reductase (DIM6/NTAB) family NADH-FMN oxidoreductase RutF
LTEYHSYEPGSPHRLAHDPMTSIVAPRPIGWISTLSPDGIRNLAPYSFFNLFSSRPPIIGFASNGWKDSVSNAHSTGEFVWNLVSGDLVSRANLTSAAVPPGVDEFKVAGLTSVKSDIVAPCRVAASPVTFECKVTDLMRLHGLSGDSLDTWVVFGEVVKVHIDKECLADDLFDVMRANPVTRGGGTGDYFLLDGTRKRLVRPTPQTR